MAREHRVWPGLFCGANDLVVVPVDQTTCSLQEGLSSRPPGHKMVISSLL